MLGSQGLFPDRQRSLVERFGLGVAALGLVECRQVVEEETSDRMVGAKFILAQSQRFLGKPKSLLGAPLGIKPGEPVVCVDKLRRLAVGCAGPKGQT